jgi:BirA family biotin operon repressor/biotin-[acetyl-CoA-carboxylase] ligase
MPAEALPFLTLGVGLGIARGLQTHVTRQVKIKWPNDIWLDGKKCAGILVESRSAGPKLDYAVIGVGLNVNRDRLDPTLRNIATSMRLATGRRF